MILYIAMSVDGYIAAADGDIGFLSMVNEEGTDYGYGEFINSVDTVIMGRKTYDKVLTLVPEFPHRDKEVFIITRSEKPDKGNIKFYSGNLSELITRLKKSKGKNIFCDGGAEVVNELLRNNQVDEFFISLIPVLLGSGISLFQKSSRVINLKLAWVKSFNKGLVQLHYVRNME